MSQPSDEYVQQLVGEQMGETSREDLMGMVLESFPEYAGMIGQMDEEMLNTYFGQMLAQQVREQYSASMEDVYQNLTDEELAEDFELLLLEEDDLVWLYEHAMPPVYSDPFRPLIGLQELRVPTREDSGVLCFHSR